ncbi:hypothetical protein TNCV_2732931 [Trichonephila clavipes]|nr:hypothetical protein TNCV_2732931 [Trichonephila clavipes]
MLRVRRNVGTRVSDVDKGRIVAYQDSNLSYRSSTACFGRHSMTVRRVWNRWVQGGNSEPPPITSIRENIHVTRMALNGSCTLVTSPESRIGVVCKTTSVCTNSSMTLAAA